MKKTSLEEIMSTTKVGEIVVLKETEINSYIRGKKGLKRISSIKKEIIRINHHQCQ